MRAGRLLSILLLLQLRTRLTAQELAEEFEVSVRTIYRDIEELGAAGVPIYGDRGPGGGFQLLDGYRTRLTGLAVDEAEALFMIGMPGAAEALGMGRAAATAGRKVLAALPPSLTAEAGRLGERFHLDPMDWYREAEPAVHLPVVARAVLDERQLTMTYESWTGVRTSAVEPLGLVWKAGAWYMAAQSGGVVRIYKVSKIRTVTSDDVTFERPAHFDLPTYWRAELRRFEAALRPAVAALRASPSGLMRLSQLGAFAATAVKAAAQSDERGWLTVQLPIESIDHAALMLLGVGPEVEVLEPVALRDRLRELAEGVARCQTRLAGSPQAS